MTRVALDGDDAGITVCPVEEGEESPGLERRLRIAIAATGILFVAGNTATFFWGQWMVIPGLIGFVGIVIALTLLEARVRRTTVAEVLKEVRRNWSWRSRP